MHTSGISTISEFNNPPPLSLIAIHGWTQLQKYRKVKYLSFAAPFPFQTSSSFSALVDMKSGKSTKIP
jgi:hypothetical protein